LVQVVQFEATTEDVSFLSEGNDLVVYVGVPDGCDESSSAVNGAPAAVSGAAASELPSRFHKPGLHW
jgi:hypothetical protein